MIFPRPTSEFLTWIPHRPPMVWIDAVESVEDDGGTCSVTLMPDGLYLTDGALRESSFVEFLAQSFGFIGICRQMMKAAGQPPILKKAFLANVRGADFLMTEETRPRAGAKLTVRMYGLRDMSPIQMTEGEALDTEGRVLMRAHLKVFTE